MATITLRQKKTVYAGIYSGWGTITGNTIIGSNYSCHCIYSADVSMSSAERITSINFKNTFASDISGSLVYHCYIYSSDPTSGNPSSPPSTGLLHHFQLNKTITQNGLVNNVTLTSLNLASVTNLYFWVTAQYDATSGGIYCCDQSGISQPTAATITTAQQSLTLAVLPNSVTTSAAGSKVGLTIGNGGSYTLYADFYYGNAQTPFASVRVYDGNNQVTCPRSWFDDAGVTTLLSMTITVKIRGGSNVPTGSFTLNAGRDMQPTVGTVTTSIVQSAGAAQDYPNTYIAGISKVKITASITLNTNAAIANNGVYFYYPGGSNVIMSLNQQTGLYEGTTAAPITQDTTFTVRAVDVRRAYGENTASISGVVAYTRPSVVVNTAYRCNNQGQEESGGEYWKIRVTATYSTSLSGNSVTVKAGVKNGTMNTLTSGQMCGPYSGTTNPLSAYTIVITVQDLVSGVILKEITLEGMQRDFVLNHTGGKTHLGVGLTPLGKDVERDVNTIELPYDGLFLVGGIPAQAFNYFYKGPTGTSDNPGFGKDFLNVDFAKRTGAANATAVFGFGASAISQWSHVPNDSEIQAHGWIGCREVYYLNSNWALVKITEISPLAGRIWYICHGLYNGEYTWGKWRYLNPTVVQ